MNTEPVTGPYRKLIENAPALTADTWAELAEVVRKRTSIQSLIGYILQLAHGDMVGLVKENPFTPEGQASIARLQGAINAKRWVVGHICDMLGDVPPDDDMPGTEANPLWLNPDDEEEQEEQSRRVARRTPTRSTPQRAKPTPPRKAARRKPKRTRR